MLSSYFSEFHPHRSASVCRSIALELVGTHVFSVSGYSKQWHRNRATSEFLFWPPLSASVAVLTNYDVISIHMISISPNSILFFYYHGRIIIENNWA